MVPLAVASDCSLTLVPHGKVPHGKAAALCVKICITGHPRIPGGSQYSVYILIL